MSHVADGNDINPVPGSNCREQQGKLFDPSFAKREYLNNISQNPDDECSP
jgi:hypothetical protein